MSDLQRMEKQLRRHLIIMLAFAIFILASSSQHVDAQTISTQAAAIPVNEKIGVPECDSFIANYLACVSSKAPKAARAQYRSAVDQWRASWKKLADNPATRGALAAACKQAAVQADAALQSYG